MTFQATVDFLYAQLPVYQRQGATAMKKDLGNIRALCKLLGNPQLDFPVIHIAGTNGKGSTTHLIASILVESGFKTGMYVSPHYFDFRERIKIGSDYVSKQFVIGFVQRIQPFLKVIQPSFFEITVAMAFDYFSRKKVDVAVIETGLGGRLDSTNIVSPLLTVITNISMDHQQFLGDTMVSIAGEKAGIIKRDIPIIIGETQPEVQAVFEEKAKEMNAPLTFADQLLSPFIQGNNLQITHVIEGLPKELSIENKGPFYSKNVITALASIQALKLLGWEISENQISVGMQNLYRNTRFFGRWEILGKEPMILLDGAHNEGGIQVLMTGIEKLAVENMHMVMGFVADKKLNQILPLFPKQAKYYFVKAAIDRALNPEKLKQKAEEFGLNGAVFSTVTEGFKAALKTAGKRDLVFVGGSIFVVGEILSKYKK